MRLMMSIGMLGFADQECLLLMFRKCKYISHLRFISLFISFSSPFNYYFPTFFPFFRSIPKFISILIGSFHFWRCLQPFHFIFFSSCSELFAYLEGWKAKPGCYCGYSSRLLTMLSPLQALVPIKFNLFILGMRRK